MNSFFYFIGFYLIIFYSISIYLPASLASLQASYMACLISGLSSAIVSPTVTKRSTARFTAWPTRATARRLRSEHSGRSLCETRVEICKQIYLRTTLMEFFIRLKICELIKQKKNVFLYKKYIFLFNILRQKNCLRRFKH